MNRSRNILTAALLAAVCALPVQAQESEDAVRSQVADLVRAGLTNPESSETWEGLAELLPELALTDRADPVGVFEASRLADSMAAAPLLPSEVIAANLAAAQSRPQTSAASMAWTDRAGLAVSTLWGRTFDGARSILQSATPADILTVLPWILVGLILITGLAVRARKTTSLRRRRSRSTEAAEAPARDPREQRRWTVTTLAESGLPPAEIARRTGMAQDAVQVLLGLRSAPNAPASRTGTRPNPMIPGMQNPGARPPSLGEQAAGIATARADLTRESRRLKGGRLVYGPGN